MRAQVTAIVENFVNELLKVVDVTATMAESPRDNPAGPQPQPATAPSLEKSAVDAVKPPPRSPYGKLSPYALRFLEAFRHSNGIPGPQLGTAIDQLSQAVARDLGDVLITCDGSRHQFTVQRPHSVGFIQFACGEPHQEGFTPGLHDEDLLRVLIHRFRGFQEGPATCHAHAVVLGHLNGALEVLADHNARAAGHGPRVA